MRFSFIRHWLSPKPILCYRYAAGISAQRCGVRSNRIGHTKAATPWGLPSAFLLSIFIDFNLCVRADARA